MTALPRFSLRRRSIGRTCGSARLVPKGAAHRIRISPDSPDDANQFRLREMEVLRPILAFPFAVDVLARLAAPGEMDGVLVVSLLKACSSSRS